MSRVHIHSYSTVSDYTRNSRYNTGYSHPGHKKKDVVFKETADFIAQASLQRFNINRRLKEGAKILPCLT